MMLCFLVSKCCSFKVYINVYILEIKDCRYVIVFIVNNNYSNKKRREEN